MQEVTIPLHEYLELYKKSLALEAVVKAVQASKEADLGFVDCEKIQELFELVGVDAFKE